MATGTSLDMNDPLPFASLSDQDLLLLRTPPPGYTSLEPMASVARRRKSTPSAADSAPSGSRRSLSSSRRRSKKRRLRSSAPSLPLQLMMQQEWRRLSSQQDYHRRSSQSWLSYFLSPSWPMLIVIVFACVAASCGFLFLRPLSEALGSLITRLANFNPVEAMEAVLAPASAAIAAVPLAKFWCNTIAIGCPELDRYAAFRTDSFASLPLPVEQISLGNDFFDCLNDLKITRQQKHAVAHLITLAPKVMQFAHVLESPQELSNDLVLLARMRREIVMNANAARLTGRGAVGDIIMEFEHTKYLSATKASPRLIQQRLRDTMSATHESLHATSDYTVRTSEAVESAEELASKVSAQIHQEISYIRDKQQRSEMGLEYIAWGWLEPGRKGVKHDRAAAAGFLIEVQRVLDESAVVLVSSSMSLQQCAINTRGFRKQVEKAFTLEHDRLSIQQQMQYLSPSIGLLDARLAELRQSDNVPSTSRADAPEAG